MIEITEHASERLKERNGLTKSSQDRITEKVLRNGIRHGDTSGQLKRWVDRLYLTGKRANNIRLYGDKAYLFRDATLITVLQIPNRLQPAVNKISKRKRCVNE